MITPSATASAVLQKPRRVRELTHLKHHLQVRSEHNYWVRLMARIPYHYIHTQVHTIAQARECSAPLEADSVVMI
jgi:hypothetical protein